jgi:putative ABC transport system permease protein
VALGALLGAVISAIGIPMPPPPNSDSGFTAHILFVPSVAALSFGIGVAATVLAALLPARRVMRLKVVDALRENV